MADITSQQIMNFLLKPESNMSIVFLVIFLLLFAFGIWIFFRLRSRINSFGDNAVKSYSEVSSKISPEEFVKKSVDELSAMEGILEGIPDMFVSIGILATFIGLGIAIQNASELLSAETLELDKFITLLGIISFKFQTSVWGIFFSLVFRRFFVETYFEFRQNVIDSVRNRLYKNERDGIQTLLEKQNELLEKQFEYHQHADSDRQQKFDEFSQTLQNFIQDYISAVFVEHMDKVNESLQMINDSLRKFNDDQNQNHKYEFNEIQKLNSNISQHIDALTNFQTTAEKFSDEVQIFSGYVDEYKNVVDSSFEKIININEKVIQTQEEAMLLAKQSIDDTQKVYINSEKQYRRNLEQRETQYVSEMNKKLSAMLETTAEQFKQALDKSISQVSGDYNNVLNTFNDKFSENMQKIGSDYTREIQRYDSIANQLTNVLDGIDQNVKNLHGTMLEEQKQLSNSSYNLLEQMQTAVDEFNSASKIHADDVSNIYKSIQDSLTKMQSMNSQHGETLRNFTNAFISSASMMNRNQTEDINNRIEQLDSIVQAMQDISKELSTDRMKYDTERMKSIDEIRQSIVDSISKLNQTQIESTQKLESIMKNILAMQIKAQRSAQPAQIQTQPQTQTVQTSTRTAQAINIIPKSIINTKKTTGDKK